MRGIVGLLREFKILDSNKNGTVELRDFVASVTNFGIQLTDQDYEILFA